MQGEDGIDVVTIPRVPVGGDGLLERMAGAFWEFGVHRGCCIRAFNLCGVKFLSRLLTALNLLPSIATSSSPNSPSLRLNWVNSRQTCERFEVVPAEVGNGLEVGLQSTDQPHHFDVEFRLALQQTPGPHSIQIPIDVNLEEIAG